MNYFVPLHGKIERTKVICFKTNETISDFMGSDACLAGIVWREQKWCKR